MEGLPPGEPTPEDFPSVQAFLSAFEAYHDQRSPSRQETLDRAVRLASEAMRGVSLQLRRMQRSEPEDDEWLLRRVTDFRFLVIALWRLRACANIAADVDEGLRGALDRFDRRVPDLASLRNVDQHIDDYAIDHPSRRRQRTWAGALVGRRALEVWSLNGTEVSWIGRKIDLSEAVAAANSLYASMRTARDVAPLDLK